MTREPSAAIDIERLLDDNLSPVRTGALLAAGAVGLAEAVLLPTMLVTEPTRPPALTVAAIGAIAATGFAWFVLAAWRLTTRRVLLLRDRVYAWALASTCTVGTTVGAVAIALVRDDGAVAATVGTGGVAVAVAVAALLRRSMVDHHRARARLVELESSA